jgi:hypothetical protein
MAMSPVGLGTKNDCVGEHQEQFTRPTRKSALSFIVSSRYLTTTSKQTEDFLCAVVLIISRLCESVRPLRLFVVRVIGFQ